VTVNPTYLIEDSLSFPLGQTPVWQDINLGNLPEGDTTLVVRYESAQGCDSVHVLRLTVLPKVITYGDYETSFCQGDSVEFAGQWYSEATQKDVLLQERNSQSGDSIVHLTLTVNPTYLIEDSLSFPLGQTPVWQDINLGNLPEGDTTLYVRYESALGCDSIHALHLTVLPMVITYGNDTALLCAGERFVYEGKTYRHTTVDSVKVSERNQFGGDSIVELVVYVFPTLRVSNTMTITEGDSATWQGIDLSGISVGDTTLTVSYTSIHGCDSVYMLELTVNEAQEMALDEIDATQTAEKFFHNGQLYIRKNRHVYNLQGIKVEIED